MNIAPVGSGKSNLETASAHSRRGYDPVTLFAQNNLMETQAHSRLAVLRQVLAAKGLRGIVARRHSGYRPVAALPGSSPSFGGTPAFAPGGRMFTLFVCTHSRFNSCARGGKQEGAP